MPGKTTGCSISPVSERSPPIDWPGDSRTMKSCSRSIHNCAHVKTRITSLFATVLAIAFLTASASAATSPTVCNNQVLPAGNGGDLIGTTGTCTVDGTAPSGTYLYKNVNIIL